MELNKNEVKALYLRLKQPYKYKMMVTWLNSRICLKPKKFYMTRFSMSQMSNKANEGINVALG